MATFIIMARICSSAQKLELMLANQQEAYEVSFEQYTSCNDISLHVAYLPTIVWHYMKACVVPRHDLL
jgi:hypothetical protein